MNILWAIFFVTLFVAAVTWVFVFVNQNAKHLPENVGLTIVVICYINIFAVIVSGIILAAIHIFRFFHLI